MDRSQNSEHLPEAVRAYDERTRPRKRRERAGFTGAAMLEGSGFCVLLATGSTVGGWLGVAGIVVAAPAVASLASRSISRSEIKDKAKRAEQEERLQAVLPKLNPQYGLKDALANMRLDWNQAEIDVKRDVGNRDALFRSIGIGNLVQIYDLGEHGYGGSTQGIAGMAVLTLLEYAAVKRAGAEANNEELKSMLDVLDSRLPIDPRSDTLTPINEATGTKTWASYMAVLYDDAEMQRELFEQSGHSLAIMPANFNYEAL